MKLNQSELLESIEPVEAMVGQTYVHYKGDIYRVTGVSIDCNTSEPRVHYCKIGMDRITFSRPYSEWNQMVDDKTARFERVRLEMFYMKDNGEILSGV